MRPSEAIREGAKIRPQAYYSYFEHINPDIDRYRVGIAGSKDDPVGSCVMGAAYEARFNKCVATEWSMHELLEAFPALKQEIDEWGSLCGCPLTFTRTVHSLCVHLNAHHYWTREAIADLLESKGL